MRVMLAKLDFEGFVFATVDTLDDPLPQNEGATLVRRDAHTLAIDMPRAMDLNRVFAALDGAGIRVRSMRPKTNRLEELFVRMTGPQSADEDAAAVEATA